MNQVIIYGMSHAGLRIASFLKETGAEVTVAVQKGSEFMPRLERLHMQIASGDLKDFAFLSNLLIDEAQSIILPSEDDLFNLNAALHAVEIKPEIRVVLQLFNLNLGEKLEKSVRNFTVLSVAQLASSTFAIAALLEKPLLSFESGDEILAIYVINGGVFPGKSIAEVEREHELKVLSINDDTFPAADRQIGPTEKLAIFSRFSTASDLCGVHACTSRTRDKRKDRDAKKGVLNIIRQLDAVLLRTIAALIAVAAASVLFFHAAEGLSFLDSAYFVVTVLTTTGFGDISLKDSAAASKMVGIGLMLAGMALMAMLFAIISDNLLKKRLELLLGRRRIKLRDHVVLCGLGDVGIRILEDLVRIKETVVVVEKNPDGKFIHQVRQQNIPLIISDATQEETLANANIKGAKAIICATDNDILNLEIGLNAQSLQPGIKVVLRIFEKDFAEKIEKHFDLHVALSSSAIAAPAFASAARGTGTIGMIDLNGRRFQVKEALYESINIKALIQKDEARVLMAVQPNGQLIMNGIESSLQGNSIIYVTSS